jgi:mono/diheme cytochrome c family protein
MIRLLLLVLCLLVGCDARIERFQPNSVHALALSRSQSVGTQQAVSDVAAVVKEVFGTPEQPRWPAELLPVTLGGIVDTENLTRAAGAVSSDKAGNHFGLYREHCATCHATEGSGAGPAAMLQNPYPRDFRAGVFKWKSTERAAKPTRDDLRMLLEHGVPGTGMPSFALIAQEDREALVDYLIYLSIRGEVERKLLDACVYELGYDDETELTDEERLSLSTEVDNGTLDIVAATFEQVVNKWQQASSRVVPVASIAQPAGSIAAAIERGRDIFHSQIANCAGCHGPGGNGQAVTLDYDDWTKEYTTRLGLTPSNREAIKPFRQAGALRPRIIQPRNLQDGIFRGGADDETLYRRISQGIAGTPMPGVEITSQASAKSLSSDQVWDLIYYLRSLSTAELSTADTQQSDESRS